MGLKRIALTSCAVILVMGCSSMTIESQHDDDVDFSKYQTWNWLPEPPQPEADVRLTDPALHRRIRAALESQLLEQGFQRAATSPDFFIKYHVALRDNLSQTMVDDNYDNASYAEYATNWEYQYSYDWLEGTLLIDILDSQTIELVWRGSARAEIKLEATDDEKEKRVKEAVEKMLKSFRPK